MMFFLNLIVIKDNTDLKHTRKIRLFFIYCFTFFHLREKIISD